MPEIGGRTIVERVIDENEVEERSMKEILEYDFKDDPVYKLCLNKDDLKLDMLFSPAILGLSKKVVYSTVDAGKILQRNDSTIRNHFRTDIIKYIKPEKHGKYYRLDYKSVFRLHMVFVLMENTSSTSTDILIEAGLQQPEPFADSSPTIRKKQGHKESGLQSFDSTGYEDLAERVDILEHFSVVQTHRLNISEYEKQLTRLNQIVMENAHEIEKIKTAEHIKYLEDRQSRLLTASLNKTFEKKGFFGFKKPDSLKVELPMDLEEELKKKKEDLIAQNIKIHEDQVANAKSEIIRIEKDLERERGRLNQLATNEEHRIEAKPKVIEEMGST